MKKLGKITGEDDEYEYKVDFANLIRNLNYCLHKMIINPTKESVSFYSLWLIEESCQGSNKIKKNRIYLCYKLATKKHGRSYGDM